MNRRRTPIDRALQTLLPADAVEYEGVRFLVHHCVVGLGAAVLFFALLVGFDLFKLRTLLVESGHGWIGGALLLFGLMITFGSVAMGVAVMSLGKERR
jgi:hypothetical protein